MNALSCSFCAKTTFHPDLIDDLVVIKVYVMVCAIPCALLMLLGTIHILYNTCCLL